MLCSQQACQLEQLRADTAITKLTSVPKDHLPLRCDILMPDVGGHGVRVLQTLLVTAALLAGP